MKVEFNEKTKQWEQLPLRSKEGMYLDGRLKRKLDAIREIQKKDWDCVFLIDGMEGSGKSTLGKSCAWYLSDKNFTKDNFCVNTKQAIQKLGTFPDESVLVIDEGDIAFSSKRVWDMEQQRLIELIKVIRYKKMILIIIAPSFFDLNRGIAIRRSRFLLHVYTDKKLTRGRFAYFGQKKKEKLFLIGKKNFNSYSKPRSDFVGGFTNFKVLEDEYQKIKQEIVDNLIKEKEPVTKNITLLRLEYRITKVIGKTIMKREELAKILGVDGSTISKWKNLPKKYPFVLENKGFIRDWE